MVIKRRNQSSLQDNEWNDFVDTVNKLHESNDVNWNDLVKIHVDAMSSVGSAWGVHSMGSGDGRNFLAWHRDYLLFMENKLRSFNPEVTLPYWDSYNDVKIPNQLSKQEDLDNWGVSRTPTLSQLDPPEEIDALNLLGSFNPFQKKLEVIHNSTHRYVGGQMQSAASPTDPLFWLHHANIDRLWSNWQKKNPGKDPDNIDEQLKPSPIISRKVEELLNIETLDYKYE